LLACISKRRRARPYVPYDKDVLLAVTGHVAYTTTTTHFNGGILVAGLVIQLLFAALPAWMASRKGYSFALFYLFGFFCWLPAIIVAAVISSKVVPPGGFGYSYGASGQGPVWGGGGGGYAPPSAQQPVLPPSGWYPDPGGSSQQRYWDGNSWTDHLH
jgi:Protein of unknown function (DUF2510)